MLLPISRMFPRVDQDFLAGLEGGLADAAFSYELIVEPVGACALKDIVIDRVQRVLYRRPHVVTGVMGSGISQHVHDFFRESRTSFIVNDLGAEPLFLGGARNPYIFWNSFNLWQSAYALGHWAAQNLGMTACISAAFHESGYGIVQAFWQAFEHAGGRVLGIEVTHKSSAVADPSAQVQRLADLHPDFIMGFYSGREGISFINAYSALARNGALPLIATPFMTHRNWLPQMGDAALGIRTAFSWDPAANPEAHDGFRRACRLIAPDEPDVFALLGYETGRVIAQAFAAIGETADPQQLRSAIAGGEISSPRGVIAFDPETGDVGTVDYLQEIRRGPGGELRAETIGALTLPQEYLEDYRKFKDQEARSGWINPYLVN